MTAKTLTPTSLAEVLGTDARTARKFLRSITPKDSHPGKGSRWSVEGNAKAIAAFRKKFAEFSKAQDEAKAAREAAKVADTPEVDPMLDPDSPDFEDEPTDEDLAAIDAEEI